MHSPMHNWLDAPFLKEVDGKGLYGLMNAVKTGALTGEMECALNRGAGGRVVVLHFVKGHPEESKDKLADLVRQQNIVVAWMPGKVSRGDDSLLSAIDYSDCENVLKEMLMYGEGDEWAAILAGREPVAMQAIDEQSQRLGQLAALTSELNATCAAMFENAGLERMVIRFGTDRYGVDMMPKGHSLLYRITEEQQPIQRLASQSLYEKLQALEVEGDGKTLASTSGRTLETEYIRVKPERCNGMATELNEQMETSEQRFSQIWLPVNESCVCMIRSDQSWVQQYQGEASALIGIIQRDFSRLVGLEPDDCVIHFSNFVLWLQFNDQAAGPSYVGSLVESDSQVYLREVKKQWKIAEEVYAHYCGNASEDSPTGQSAQNSELERLQKLLG